MTPHEPIASPPPDALRREARVLGRLILKREVEAEFLDRYIEAHRHLFLEPPAKGEAAVLEFAVRHSRLLPCIDGAAALTAPNSLLHRKSLLMAAILEASPRYADEFLPRRATVPGLIGLGLVVGVVAAVHVAIGLPILKLVGRGA